MSSLPTISKASVIIGFISFAITLATFVRVIWDNLRTLGNAQTEVQDIMGNLKQSLIEERQHLRACRRRLRGEYDEGAFKILSDGVRHMCENFKGLEQPFLQDPRPRPHSRKRSPNHSDGEMDDYYNLKYKRLDLWDRLRWLRSKNQIQSISDALQKLQTRRIARQLTDVAATTHYISNSILDVEDRVSLMEQRVTRSKRP